MKSMFKQKGNALYGLLLISIWLGGIIGWVLNIVKIAHSSFDALTGMLVLRGIGVFIAPLGAVLGYL